MEITHLSMASSTIALPIATAANNFNLASCSDCHNGMTTSASTSGSAAVNGETLFLGHKVAGLVVNSRISLCFLEEVES